MTEAQRSFAPDGRPTVIPRIFTSEPEALVRFLQQVFNATGGYRGTAPSELRIGDSMLMISDTSVRRPTVAFLYVYVPDADAAYRRAVDAGARSFEPPLDTPYGDRRCMVEDPWGNTWQIATRAARP